MIYQLGFTTGMYIILGIISVIILAGVIFWQFFDKLTKIQLKLFIYTLFALAIALLFLNVLNFLVYDELVDYVGGFEWPFHIFIGICAVIGSILRYRMKKEIFSESSKKEEAHAKEQKSETPQQSTEDSRDEPEEESKYERFFKKGLYYYREGRYKRSASYFVDCIAIYSDTAEPWYYIGLINKKRNRIREAKKAFSEALKRNNHYPQAKRELAKLVQADSQEEVVTDKDPDQNE